MNTKITTLLISLMSLAINAQFVANDTEENIDNWPERVYDLTIGYETVNYTGKDVKAMTINGGIPGPNLEFNEGEFAIINVTNKMDEETSVHWHGLILPNFYDGVPYLTTPPIKPGETQQYKFALKQSGTYWYHSHTGLQEQRGVYGSIQINPKDTDLEYDKDLVLVLSDWMDENPKTQLKNLKRGNEWYLIKKNQVQSWDKVIAKGAVGAKLKMMWQRMPDMAILDNYYDLFFINGRAEQNYPDFKPGEKVRVRFVNAAAATYFWLTFGGEDPMLISADGLDVVPVKKNKTLIGVAETYDFIVTVPESGKLEIRVTSQDGSGQASAYMGTGDILKAPDVPVPDLIKQMQQLMSMDMKMGAPAAKLNPSKNDSIKKMMKYAMKMDGMQMDGMKKDKDSTKMKGDGMAHQDMKLKEDKMQMDGGMNMGYMVPQDKVIGDNMKTGGNPEFNYHYLEAPGTTEFEEGKPVREMLFNLTGNMNRYVWSINGVPLSETDKIKINQGEVVRITLNNMTMMHHPMHLHGHFFRVLNENGDRSPLKHTVNVAPMQKVVIEFDAVEYGDWFFHCHVLYHMNSGMARVFSYDTPRDERLTGYPLSNLTTEADHIWTWGEVTTASHLSELFLTATNIRNQFILRGEYGWNENLEAEFTYERWLNSYFRVFGGVNMENEMEDSMDEISTTGVVGVRYLLPLLIDSDLRIDNKLRPTISLSTATMIFRNVALYGEYEYQMDFGWVNDFEPGTDFEKEVTWQVGLEFVLSRDFSLMGSYDNRFGAGGGLSLRF
ncbi:MULTISPECIES: multicopper oxidase domain-containing protein [unclassified Robiginitalea]|uniref:multicopper oxidase domain-containing protein n=1 Tax=Robiginitalea TaxID=252306 RepID=UPI00234AAA25|nr:MULTISPECIES: multicopper oxidase domain-containing protein [unclassified Robiginitalea]MDC6353551.1 multicopper oxidase domain-containing protein [Robiginitalea sp. PM2]MDC6373284.1 multicopper oxidase domain-containing protein [Robiginitalea sp. SP8]